MGRHWIAFYDAVKDYEVKNLDKLIKDGDEKPQNYEWHNFIAEEYETYNKRGRTWKQYRKTQYRNVDKYYDEDLR